MVYQPYLHKSYYKLSRFSRKFPFTQDAPKREWVILVNESLRRYIREKFPLYKIIFSTTGAIGAKYPMSEKTFNLYEKNLESCDILVPSSDNNYDARLRDLDISRIEILVSDSCVLNCPKRDLHYSLNAAANRGESSLEETLKLKSKCLLNQKVSDQNKKLMRSVLKDRYPYFLYPYQIKGLLNEGFSNFKIQGRDSDDTTYLYFLNRYLVDYDKSREDLLHLKELRYKGSL